MGKNYLITGITGFAGPHLANLCLARGDSVTGLIRNSNGRENDIRDVVSSQNYDQLKFVYGDMTDKADMDAVFAQQKYDGVFHLAAQSHPPTSFKFPEATFIQNAIGTMNIASAIAKHSPETRFMMCSTAEVYGRVPEEAGPIKETFPLSPINPYGVSKAAADLYVRERAVSAKLPFFVTRAFAHTGPRRGNTFSVSSDAYQVAKIVKGLQEPRIKVGKLESRRVVVDVRDCVAAYFELMQDKFTPGEAYNVGGDELFSMGELLDIMLEKRNLKGKVELYRDPALVRPIGFGIQVPDSTKVRQATGWKPQIAISKTLDDLLNYWESKISQVK